MAFPISHANDNSNEQANDLADSLAQQAGQGMELNQRYLNRQLGRVLQTLGFDRRVGARQRRVPDRQRGP